MSGQSSFPSPLTVREDDDGALKFARDARYIYSGRVNHDHPLGDEFLWVYVATDRNDGQTVQIESAPGPSGAMLTLDKKQTEALYRCLQNALRRWRGEEP